MKHSIEVPEGGPEVFGNALHAQTHTEQRHLVRRHHGDDLHHATCVHRQTRARRQDDAIVARNSSRHHSIISMHIHLNARNPLQVMVEIPSEAVVIVEQQNSHGREGRRFLPTLGRMSKPISSASAAAPVAAYSQAVAAGNLVFVSGQIPLNPASHHLVDETIEAATRQSLSNVRRILEEAGLGLDDVVKATVFLIDSGDYAGMDATYRDVMPQPFPAREAVFVAGLPKGARVEISVIAHREG